MGDLAQALIKYGRPFWSAIGDDNAASVAGSTQMLSDYLFGPEATDAQRSFEEGRRDFKQGLRKVRFENPYGAFAAEMAGNILLGTGAGKALKMSRLLKILDKPFQVSAPVQLYPKRTRQQWQADLQYGKEQFNALRARGPLKREGHPDAAVTHKSWDKIRNGNIPEKYDMLPDVQDIYATGEHHIQPRLKERMDEFDRFHWFQKNNKGIQIGENQHGRTLYNVNPDVRQYLIEHPEVARRLGIDIKQL